MTKSERAKSIRNEMAAGKRSRINGALSGSIGAAAFKARSLKLPPKAVSPATRAKLLALWD